MVRRTEDFVEFMIEAAASFSIHQRNRSTTKRVVDRPDVLGRERLEVREHRTLSQHPAPRLQSRIVDALVRIPPVADHAAAALHAVIAFEREIRKAWRFAATI